MKQRSQHDLHLGIWLGGAALGALAMYMMDPDRGAPRRALSGTRLRQLGRQGGDVLDKVVRKVGARAHAKLAERAGDMASAAGAGSPDGGRRQAQAGTAMTGPDERRRSLVGRSWWPSAMRNGAMPGRRMPLAMVMGLAGAALLMRAMRSGAPPGLARGQTRSGLVTIERCVRIDVPPEQVYELWASYDNFPRFMANVLEVRELGNRRSHWLVKGPAGSEVGFDTVLTEQLRPRRLAWHSLPGAEVEQAASVQFEASGGGTLATVRLSYRPPAGALGKAVATLFGGDPERALEEDLGRMKNLLEGTSTPRAAAQSGDRPPLA
ncbi:SRPBCC family protein [Massilia atriviolacea]|uniref:SRPBCC family protein n=1 Tax=Massilia atriviolacea TaxID=2495579 RepID=A0A430HRN1_9BURK|nr:SRPBCC family protein [Massilia atriviolacea]RSZ60174.1 SRPBCC family protein [Massilia atriviolacea]